jgi:hypothetical protein
MLANDPSDLGAQTPMKRYIDTLELHYLEHHDQHVKLGPQMISNKKPFVIQDALGNFVCIPQESVTDWPISFTSSRFILANMKFTTQGFINFLFPLGNSFHGLPAPVLRILARLVARSGFYWSFLRVEIRLSFFNPEGQPRQTSGLPSSSGNGLMPYT